MFVDLTKSDCDIKYIIFKVKNQRVRPCPLLSPVFSSPPGAPVWEIPRIICLLISPERQELTPRSWGRGALQAGRGLPRGLLAARAASPRPPLAARPRGRRARGAPARRRLGVHSAASSKPHSQRRLRSPRAPVTPVVAKRLPAPRRPDRLPGGSPTRSPAWTQGPDPGELLCATCLRSRRACWGSPHDRGRPGGSRNLGRASP